MSEALKTVLKTKIETKKNFATEFGFSEKKALIGIVLDKDLPQSDEELLKSVLEGAEALDVQVIVLKDKKIGEIVDEFTKVSKNVHIFEYSCKNREKLLIAADITMSFDFNDVEEMLLNGVVPISLKRPEIDDYNPNRETGNAFVYKKKDKWCAFAALVRASETFKFPYDWKNIVRQALERNS